MISICGFFFSFFLSNHDKRVLRGGRPAAYAQSKPIPFTVYCFAAGATSLFYTEARTRTANGWSPWKPFRASTHVRRTVSPLCPLLRLVFQKVYKTRIPDPQRSLVQRVSMQIRVIFFVPELSDRFGFRTWQKWQRTSRRQTHAPDDFCDYPAAFLCPPARNVVPRYRSRTTITIPRSQ